MMTPVQAAAVRSALQQLPKASASSVGRTPTTDEIFVLKSHMSAIDPEVSLVVGNRGMGKTFWANVLHDPETREFVANKHPASRIQALRQFSVAFGFADREGAIGVSANEIRQHRAVDPEDFWRAVLISTCRSEVGPKMDLDTAVMLISTSPNQSREMLRELDKKLDADGRGILILFDQLDQLADDWTEIQRLSKALLRVALSTKSYRHIRVKIFMRPDQALDEEIFHFPDSSKIWGEAARLRWFALDLFTLLFRFIWRDAPSREALVENMPMFRELGMVADESDKTFPWLLSSNPHAQGRLFDLIAGDKMGKGAKRGRPYSWIVTHLADGRDEISPRSFLTAIRVAADHLPEDDPTLAIDYKGIQNGVAEASKLRHKELYEDYPWIKEALAPLSGLVVPSERAEVYDRWVAAKVVDDILRKHSSSKAPIEVVNAPASTTDREKALQAALQALGVIEERTDDRINVPDIFRISAQMKRKGGIAPQRRRQM